MDNNKKFRVVRPCGKLTVNGHEYFLLTPSPVVRDSWQLDTQQRWVVVPEVASTHTQVDDNHYFPIYPCARHIVCTNPLIEYNVMNHILVLVADEYDLAAIPMPEEDESDETGNWVSAFPPLDCSKWDSDFEGACQLHDETFNDDKLENLRNN